jgi:HTH-type transcriptional regulator / antitoxin HigA
MSKVETEARREWKPDWAIHPGSLLEEHLEARGLSQADFARIAGLTPKLVSTIINGTNPVTPETAIRLERVLGLKAHVWTNIQAKWDLFQARAQDKPRPGERSWLEQFPIKELRHRSCLPDTRDEGELRDELLRLFGIGTPNAYEAKVASLAVHHRQARRSESSAHHVFTWLMLGEHKARRMNLPSFNAEAFKVAVRGIRQLTTTDPEVFEPKMKELCRAAGVALILEPAISKTCLFGSARWFDADRAIIQMSLRMKTNDHFWWTFFHEAAHITLHRGKNFMDDQNGIDGDEAKAEAEADQWAEEILVGRQRFAQFKATQPRSRAQVERFAKEVRLHPGIVVGMLQHSRIIPFQNLNGLKAKFAWAPDRSD